MEVQLSVEQEAELSRIADETGRSADELAREILGHYIAEESRFHAGVRAGLDAAARGDFLPTSEFWAKAERVLKGERAPHLQIITIQRRIMAVCLPPPAQPLPPSLVRGNCPEWPRRN